jgi:hypothetical protein
MPKLAFFPARMRWGSKALASLLASITLLLGFVSVGNAELVERGDLFVRFDGGIAPGTLPRTHLAPIAIRVAGTITTLSGETPPALRRIRIALNAAGRLDSRGLPTCGYRQIATTSSEVARGLCGSALVGEGDYESNTAFPEQTEFPSKGHILAFNAVYRHREAILAHIYGTDPLPSSRIVPFTGCSVSTRTAAKHTAISVLPAPRRRASSKLCSPSPVPRCVSPMDVISPVRSVAPVRLPGRRRLANSHA